MSFLTLAGEIIAGDQRYPVTEVALRNGKIEFVSVSEGPHSAIDSEPLTITGEDGQVVIEGGHLTAKQAKRGETFQIVVTFTITSVDDADDDNWKVELK